MGRNPPQKSGMGGSPGTCGILPSHIVESKSGDFELVNDSTDPLPLREQRRAPRSRHVAAADVGERLHLADLYEYCFSAGAGPSPSRPRTARSAPLSLQACPPLTDRRH